MDLRPVSQNSESWSSASLVLSSLWLLSSEQDFRGNTNVRLLKTPIESFSSPWLALRGCWYQLLALYLAFNASVSSVTSTFKALQRRKVTLLRTFRSCPQQVLVLSSRKCLILPCGLHWYCMAGPPTARALGLTGIHSQCHHTSAQLRGKGTWLDSFVSFVLTLFSLTHNIRPCVFSGVLFCFFLPSFPLSVAFWLDWVTMGACEVPQLQPPMPPI